MCETKNQNKNKERNGSINFLKEKTFNIFFFILAINLFLPEEKKRGWFRQKPYKNKNTKKKKSAHNFPPTNNVSICKWKKNGK